jgi:hypothetical protein
MPAHETKTCARCQQAFECKMGDISHCHCKDVQLTLEELAFIESRYVDCLCHQCLLDLKNKTVLFREKYLFR